MRQSVVCSLAAVLVIGLLASCRHQSDASQADRGGESGSQPDHANPPLVIFDLEGNRRAAVLVEVVRTREQIRQGLMYRRSLDENSGMLFLMNEETVHSFWMRNTYVALDMIFIRRDKTVAGVVANATPLTDDSRTIAEPSFYVLEVNAGWAAKHGVGADTRVRFKNIRE